MPPEPNFPRFVEWCGEFLARADCADNRDKLAGTGAKERHMVVGVTITSDRDAQRILYEGQGLPSVAPLLPSEITHLWVFGLPPHNRCIFWFPEDGWRDFSSVAAALQGSS
jgi:hypothetical protein